MAWIIDLIVVAFIALCVFLGYKRGLAGSVLKILSFIIAIIIAFILFKPVSNFIINNTLIDEKLEESIVNIIKKDTKEDGKIEKEDTNLPDSMVNYINDSVGTAIGEAKDNLINQAAKNIAQIIINAAVAIGVFIIARVILIFVKAISNLITDLPIIKQFDKTGGIIYGLLEGLIIIFIIFAVISFISPLIEKTGLVTMLNKSFIGSYLYNNNLLLKILF